MVHYYPGPDRAQSIITQILLALPIIILSQKDRKGVSR
jgi:hypothetical protein